MSSRYALDARPRPALSRGAGRDRALLALYALLVVTATAIHDLYLLAGLLGLTLIAAGRDVPRVGRDAARAVALFSIIVLVSYTALALHQDRFSPTYLVRTTLRVAAIACLTSLLPRRVNLLRALAFAPTLVWLLAIAYGQAQALRRTLVDFRLALQSRTLARPRLRDRYRHAAALAGYLLRRAVHDAGEVSQAMAARGFGHD